jgi:glycerol 2-dehydrogenase (NADP+)
MPSLHATLNTGAQIPLVGLGCWMLKKVDADNPETYQMVRDALDVGYRHLDTVWADRSSRR